MPSTAPLALLDELLWDLAGLHAKLPSTSGDDAAVGMSEIGPGVLVVDGHVAFEHVHGVLSGRARVECIGR
jgi:hypothetical protein